MAKDSLLQLSAAGILKISTPQGGVSVRLDHIGLWVVGAMIKATVGDASKADLRLADHAAALPVEQWPPVVKRVHNRVRVSRDGSK